MWKGSPRPIKVANEDTKFDRFGLQPQSGKLIPFYEMLRIQNENSRFKRYSLTWI
jgi:hypothetical protein